VQMLSGYSDRMYYVPVLCLSVCLSVPSLSHSYMHNVEIGRQDVCRASANRLQSSSSSSSSVNLPRAAAFAVCPINRRPGAGPVASLATLTLASRGRRGGAPRCRSSAERSSRSRCRETARRCDVNSRAALLDLQ